MTTWKTIPSTKGNYEASSTGVIRSATRRVLKSNGVSQTFHGREIEPLHGGTGGYAAVNISVGGKVQTRRIHVLVAEAFLGPRPEGAHVCHNDGDVTNNYIENLRYDTASNNFKQRRERGTDRNVNKTHGDCWHTLMDERNLVVSSLKKGYRVCKSCARARAHMQKHPADDFEKVKAEKYRAIMAS